MKSYPGLPAPGCFIQAFYHVMFIPIYDTALSAIVLAENNRVTLSKQVHESTYIASNLEDAYLPFCL